MPTDPTIADGPVTETKPAPDYRAALEALVIAAARVEAGAHVYYDADRDALLAALTHARKVLHGQ